jgi:cytochrome b
MPPTAPEPLHDTVAGVPAWDLPTRLFHWTLLALVLSAWISYEFAERIGDESLIWHRANGLAILTLVVWRLLWGLVGSSTARFASFVRAPGAVIRYTTGLLTGGGPTYLGHNPLGALMVLALLAVLAVMGTLGLFATDDNDLVGGPLYRLVSEAGNRRATHLHSFVFHLVLLPLVALHVAAALLYTLGKKEPLIQAMVSGKKPAASYTDAAGAVIVERPLLRALVCLVAAAAIVLGGILALGGSLVLR